MSNLRVQFLLVQKNHATFHELKTIYYIINFPFFLECHAMLITRAEHVINSRSLIGKHNHVTVAEVEFIIAAKSVGTTVLQPRIMYARGFNYGSQDYGHYNAPYHLSQQNSLHHPPYHEPYIYNAPHYTFNAFPRTPSPFNHIPPSAPSAIHYPSESLLPDLTVSRQSCETHCHFYTPPSLTSHPVATPPEPFIRREEDDEQAVDETSVSEKLADSCYQGE